MQRKTGRDCDRVEDVDAPKNYTFKKIRINPFNLLDQCLSAARQVPFNPLFQPLKMRRKMS